MSNICVFTPTYNRSSYLQRVYDSLVAQSYRDFEWLIVDDGSTDDTESIVKKLEESSPFPIRYFYQENGGKQRATNYAVSLCESPVFFGLDSDDWLVPDALELMSKEFEAVRDRDDIAGVIALHGSDNGLPLGSRMPSGVRECNVWDLYYELGFTGDAAQVYKTSVLRSYSYPVVEGENFISEGIVSYAIAKKYKMRLIDKVLVLGGYQEGGLTNDSFALIRKNPNGYILVKELSIEMSRHFAQKFYHMCLCLAACRFAKRRGYIKSLSSGKGLALLCYLPSWIAYFLLSK